MPCFSRASKASRRLLRTEGEVLAQARQPTENLLQGPEPERRALKTVIVSVYIYIHMHIHIYVHTYIHTYMHIYMSICIYMDLFRYISISIYIYTCVSTYIHMCVYTCSMCLYRHRSLCECLLRRRASTLSFSHAEACYLHHPAVSGDAKQPEMVCFNTRSSDIPQNRGFSYPFPKPFKRRASLGATSRKALQP